MLAAILFLFLISALNARGITESLRSNLVMTVIEISGLTVVIVLAAIFVAGGNGDLGRIVELPADANPAIAVLGGAIIAYYSSVGFETRRASPRRCEIPHGTTPAPSSARCAARASSTSEWLWPAVLSSRRSNSQRRQVRCSPSFRRQAWAFRPGPSA